MKKYYGLIKDALTVCCTSGNEQIWKDLSQKEVGETIDMPNFYLRKIEGKYFSNVFQLCYYEPDLEKDIVWGELKFGMGRDEIASNHDPRSGERFVWISVNNRILYTERRWEKGLNKGEVCRDDTVHLYYFMEVFGLEFYHISTLDLALDCNFDVARRIKAALRCKAYTTILNGRAVTDRLDDRPEIVSVYTGNLDRDKYLTLYVKQKHALNDKSKGLVLTAYNKNNELVKSGKDYISEFYGNPKKLYRLEIHFNADDVKMYVKKLGVELTVGLIFQESFLWDMYEDALNRLLRFSEDGETLGWGYILFGDRDITTPSAKVNKMTQKPN